MSPEQSGVRDTELAFLNERLVRLISVLQRALGRRGTFLVATLCAFFRCLQALKRRPGLGSRRVGLVRAGTVYLLVALGPMPLASATETAVARVQSYPEKDAARVVLYMTGAAPFELVEGGAHGQPRIQVLSSRYSGPGEYGLGGLVSRMVISQHGDRVQVDWEAERPLSLRAFYLPAPYRLVIDVAPARMTARRSEASRTNRRRAVRPLTRVALDPGHGGEDPGALGPTGLAEKDVALEIAHRAAPLLARELGVSTLLTRDTDHRVPLEQRVAKANAFGADLFISIHCNADSSGRARGVSSYVLDGSTGKISIAVLDRENHASTDSIAGVADSHWFLRQFAAPDRSLRDLTTRSRHLAGLLQRATMYSLSSYSHIVDGGVHGAAFFVLAGARMPAVLFETSFISNAAEEGRLRQARYRQKLADGIVNAVRAYRAGY